MPYSQHPAQAERHYRRAVEDFERLKALRKELPNKAIFEAQPRREGVPNKPNFEIQPEQNELLAPFSKRTHPPENPAPAPGPPASVPEPRSDLAGDSGLLEGPPVEGRHPASAPVPRIARRATGGEGWSLPEPGRVGAGHARPVGGQLLKDVFGSTHFPGTTPICRRLSPWSILST
jgi:hypothetical protein